jgi:threonine dehydrogenase-like Zn-dependent dehydrogenase
MAVPIRNCHEIPPSISAETATLIEPLSCELGAVRSCQIGPADHVLVVGSGVAALLFVQLARLEGPRKVVSAVNRDLHVPLAQRLGADEVLVNPGLDEVTARYSTSIDAVGSDASLALAVRALAPGGHLVLYGLRDRTPTFPLHEAIFKNITVSAHTSAPWLWRDAISLVETGDVALEPLVSDVVPFEGIGRCMSASLLGGPGPRTKLKVVALHDG